MHRLVSRERDVDHVGAGIEEEVDGRELIQNTVVDGDLGALGLSLDVHSNHARSVPAAEQLLEFSPKLDVVGRTQSPECGRQVEDLAGLQRGAGGLLQEALLL